MALRPLELPDALAAQLHPVAEGLTFVDAGVPFPSANGLLLEGDDERVLVDAGLSAPLVEALVPQLTELVLTHAHFDHVMHWHAFGDVPVRLNAVEADVLADERSLFSFYGLVDEHQALWDDFQRLWPYPTGVVDATFQPQGSLTLAGHHLEVVPVPGHSPGHAMIFHEDAALLFGVDVDLTERGPWYGWPACDVDAFEAAVLDARPWFKRAEHVGSSHAPLSSGDGLARYEPFARQFLARDERVLAALKAVGGSASLDRVADEARLFYGRTVDATHRLSPAFLHLARFWMRSMTRQHLERLDRAGRLSWNGETARLTP